MRRRILAATAAVAMATAGVVVFTESPAEAHGSCVLLHLSIGTNSNENSILHLCL